VRIQHADGDSLRGPGVGDAFAPRLVEGSDRERLVGRGARGEGRGRSPWAASGRAGTLSGQPRRRADRGRSDRRRGRWAAGPAGTASARHRDAERITAGVGQRAASRKPKSKSREGTVDLGTHTGGTPEEVGMPDRGRTPAQGSDQPSGDSIQYDAATTSSVWRTSGSGVHCHTPHPSFTSSAGPPTSRVTGPPPRCKSGGGTVCGRRRERYEARYGPRP
jgi:hypothetical protein